MVKYILTPKPQPQFFYKKMQTIEKSHQLKTPIVRINEKAKKLLVKGFFKIPAQIKENKDFQKFSEQRD